MLPPASPEGRLRRLPATLCIRNHTAATGCSKAPQGLLSPMEVRGLFVHVKWLHRVAGGDSGALVGPFMHVGTYPTRHLATLSNHFGWTISSCLHPFLEMQHVWRVVSEDIPEFILVKIEFLLICIFYVLLHAGMTELFLLVQRIHLLFGVLCFPTQTQ